MQFPGAGHNSGAFDERQLGGRYGNAIVRAADAKAAAMKARKLMERVYDRILLSTEGKTVAEREARARTDAGFIAVEDQHIEAESAAIQAKAEADALEIQFEAWRTQQATARAEMNLK